jgi:hypothetical protein
MQRYYDTVTDQRGNALAGASVAVQSGGSNVSIYSDDGVTLKSNPMTTDASGGFSFYAANGTYDLVVTSASGVVSSLPSRVRLFDVADAGLATSAALSASSGAALVGFVQSGAGAVARTAQDKGREVLSTGDNATPSDGVTNAGTKIRALFADAAAGSTVLVKAGTYLVDQDGANPYCLALDKRLHLLFEPGVIFKAATAGVRSVLQVSAAITHEGSPIIDGDSKTNHAVEVVVGAKGTTFRKWEGKNVTQAHSTTFAAAPFSVVSEVGIIFDDCYAHDATSVPDTTIGNTAGAARGFHFYGTAPEFGINAVVNSRVDNIINTNGIAGAYEDEDGIVSQMTGSFCLVDNVTVTRCMKRGVKLQNRGLVNNSTIISTRTGADNALETTTRMYSAISLYSDDAAATNNRIGSGTSFGLADGGSFNYGIELGGSGATYSRISATGNTLQIGTSSNARGVEFVRLWGALLGLTLSGNKMEVATGPTINGVYGVRSDFDHATVRATVDISNNVTKNTTYAMQLKGGFSGSVSGNHAHAFSGGLGGIVVDTSASALRPANVTFSGNCGYGTDDYTVRINDTAATGLSVVGTKSESTTTAPVFINAAIRAYEEGSGGLLRPAQVYVDAPPATGTWVRGDVAINRDPRAASPVVAWRCTVAGTPGTWVAVSWITSKNTTANRPTLTASDVGVPYLDATLAPDGKPISWNGSAWVDATGATV